MISGFGWYIYDILCSVYWYDNNINVAPRVQGGGGGGEYGGLVEASSVGGFTGGVFWT